MKDDDDYCHPEVGSLWWTVNRGKVLNVVVQAVRLNPVGRRPYAVIVRPDGSWRRLIGLRGLSTRYFPA